jgi:hypothetical protein
MYATVTLVLLKLKCEHVYIFKDLPLHNTTLLLKYIKFNGIRII